MNKICDHKSVGMLVWRDGKMLMIERMKPPFGFAPPAGHLDGCEDYEEMAKIELFEETGLTTESLKLIASGRKENPCRRLDGTWHFWQIFEVEAFGNIKRSKTETKQAKWVSADELKKLANRCNQYLAGKISENDWKASPGLEPVWREWLSELKII